MGPVSRDAHLTGSGLGTHCKRKRRLNAAGHFFAFGTPARFRVTGAASCGHYATWAAEKKSATCGGCACGCPKVGQREAGAPAFWGKGATCSENVGARAAFIYT